ncbi:tautomerase family protein [Serratia marcescens]
MPLWQIYHPEPAFSAADKRAIAQKVTALYPDFLPHFYVNVFFHALPPGTAYLGGEPADDFARVTIAHIARYGQRRRAAAIPGCMHPHPAPLHRRPRAAVGAARRRNAVLAVDDRRIRTAGAGDGGGGEVAQGELAFSVGGVAALAECPMLKSDDERRFFIFA